MKWHREVSYCPDQALLHLDSLQRQAVYPSYQLEYLRACAYFSLSMYSRSLACAKHLVNSSEIKADTLLNRKIYMLLGEASVFAFSLSDAMHYLAEGKEYARRTGDEVLLASMYLSEGEVYRRIGLNNRGYGLVLKAIVLLRSKNSPADLFHLSHAYGFLMTYYIQDSKYPEAWQAGRERLQVLSRLKESEGGESRYDNQFGYCCSKMAYLAILMKRPQEAGYYYGEFLKTRLASTHMGRIEINDYLLEVGSYAQVLTSIKSYCSSIGSDDILNSTYLRSLQQMTRAYELQQNFKAAYEVAKKRLEIQKAIRLHNERNHLFEAADISQNLNLANRLTETEVRLQYRSTWVLLLSVLSGLLLVLMGVLLRKQQTIRRGNRKLAHLILEENAREMSPEVHERFVPYEEGPLCVQDISVGGAIEECFSKKTKPEEEEPTDAQLFARFSQQVCEKKLYLHYQLGRDDYARIMQVDKNRFAAILKEQAGVNLTTYLNNLRLEHSVSLFRQHPDWTICEIATQSAMPNISTFYRLFKEKYGMSPCVFRKQI